MNFSNFKDELHKLQKSISISTPVSQQVQEAHWGAVPKSVTGMPIFINNLTETGRQLGFGQRTTDIRVNMQLFVATSRTEEERASEIATNFWFAAKDVFDGDTTINDTVCFSVLQGADPTVPVLFEHGGQAYIGFNAFLNITDNEGFSLG